MIKTIALLLLISCPALAQECAHVEWFAICDVNNSCVFNSSPGVGCSSLLTSCFNCFRASLFDSFARQTGPSEFVGTFKPYKYRGHALQRFVVAIPGPLAALGVKRGDVISRIQGKRLNRQFFDSPKALRGVRLTVYKPGFAYEARAVKLR